MKSNKPILEEWRITLIFILLFFMLIVILEFFGLKEAHKYIGIGLMMCGVYGFIIKWNNRFK